jgi:hypothetical protein
MGGPGLPDRQATSGCLSRMMIAFGIVVLATAGGAAATVPSVCELPQPVLDELMPYLAAVPGHPKEGPLKIELSDHGDIILVLLPSVVVDIGGVRAEMSGLFQYRPHHPDRWSGGLSRGVDPIAILNRKIAAARDCVASAPAQSAARKSRGGFFIEFPRKEEMRIAALHRKFSECSMRPLPPEPRLCQPVSRDEFCRIERDWKDVRPRESVPSPDSPLKQAMIQAIIRAVAVRTLEDPGRNQILIRDFNVDDKGTIGALVTTKGHIVHHFGVRLDKNDPCLAEVDLLMGVGCSPCTEEMLTIDSKTRSQLLQIYPEPKPR